MSFENLKSTSGSSIDKLVKAAEAVSTKTESNSYWNHRDSSEELKQDYERQF